MSKRFEKTAKARFVSLFREVFGACRTEVEGGIRPSLVITGIGGSMEVGEGPDKQRVVEIVPVETGEVRPSLQIVGDGVGRFEALVQLLAETEGIGDVLHEDAIEEAVCRELQRLAASVPRDEEEWSLRVNAFVKHLRRGLPRLQARRTYVPVVNLKVGESVTIGQVRITPAAVALAEIEPVFSKVLANPDVGENEKAEFRRSFAPYGRSFAGAHSVASIETHCDAGRAAGEAMRSIREVVNLLRCYTPIIYGEGNRNLIGLPDDARTNPSPHISTTEYGIKFGSASDGHLMDYELDGGLMEVLRSRGAIDELGGILGKPPAARTALESSLATGAWWIGTANHSASPAERAVALATGMEALLIPIEVKDIAATLAHRASYLLAATPGDRERVSVRIKRLYDTRSSVVHKGDTHVAGADVADLAYYALALLVELARRAAAGWPDLGDFIDALDRVKFGAVPDIGPVELVPRGPLVSSMQTRISQGNGGFILVVEK